MGSVTYKVKSSKLLKVVFFFFFLNSSASLESEQACSRAGPR